MACSKVLFPDNGRDNLIWWEEVADAAMAGLKVATDEVEGSPLSWSIAWGWCSSMIGSVRMHIIT